MEIEAYGYGEDSLTLWLLKTKFKDFFEKLTKKSLGNTSKPIILYRPSFGRGGRSKSNIGEFDAIIGSSETIYLIESKWDNCKEGKVI